MIRLKHEWDLGVALVFLAALFFCNNSVFAEDYNPNVCRNESVNGEIEQISRACDLCIGANQSKISAFWFSSESYKSEKLEYASGTVDDVVYLYGAHYSCGDNGGSLTASNIAFCTEENVDCRNDESKRYKYLEPVFESLDLGTSHKSDKWSNVGEPLATTIHVKDLIKDDAPREVYIWQCEYNGEICWSEKVKLNIEISDSVKREEDLCKKWTPETPTTETEGNSSVASAVRNINTETGWIRNSESKVFAKPFDVIEFLHCYYSGAQSTANTNVTTDKKDSHPKDILNSQGVQVPKNKLPYKTLSNEIKDWGNAFNITSSGMGDNHTFINKYEFGKVGVFAQADSYTIETGNASKAGQVITETNRSSYPLNAKIYAGENHSWPCNWHDEERKIGTDLDLEIAIRDFYDACKCKTSSSGNISCPTNCTINIPMDCSHEAPGYVQYDVSGAGEEISTVVVPYNYKNEGEAKINDERVFAGETAKISSKVLTSPKYNALTDGKYATIVRDAKIRLFVYASSEVEQNEKRNVNSEEEICNAINHLDGNYCHEVTDVRENLILNTPENVYGSEYDMQDQEINIYDVDSNNYFCAVVAVWPSTSGTDDNIDTSGDGKWYISKPDCKKISKKPTFNVVGGSMYVKGNFFADVAKKNNIRNFDDHEYKVKGGETLSFGSWVDGNILLNGQIKGIASGAAYSGEDDLGGTKEKRFCKNSPLTMPNVGCNEVIGIQGVSGYKLGKQFMESVYAKFYGGNEFKRSNAEVNLNDPDSYYENGNKRYTEINKNAKIIENSAEPGITHLIYSINDIEIAGNILYDKEYSDTEEIPLYIIYTEGNINISCDVDRIDAWLLAKGTINTCFNGGDENSAERSNQLTINGVTYSTDIELGRTYGAESGLNSNVPAEIFNNTTANYLFSAEKQKTAETVNTVYLKEIK